MSNSEAVNHPSHYGGDTTYEAIKVIEAWGLGFHDGNAAKCICRAGRKTPDRLEDLKKARWYLDRLIAKLEGEFPQFGMPEDAREISFNVGTDSDYVAKG